MCQAVLCCLASFRVFWYNFRMSYEGYTPARKAANSKYIKGKIDTLTIYLPKGKRQALKDIAENKGVSLNRLIITTLEDALNISLHNDE